MLSKLTFKRAFTAMLLTLFLTSLLSNAHAERGPKGSQKGKPPQQALTACADQTEAGAACSFDTPEGDTVEGTCKSPRQNEKSLVCKPSRDSKGKRPQ